MQHTSVLAAMAAALALVTSGCISHRSTVYRDPERVKVEFESDAAARLFYETVSQGASKRNRSESTTHVGIPFVFNTERKVISGPNVEFNNAVAACDVNCDGRITEAEARVFANQY